jgi:hypothetical protein
VNRSSHPQPLLLLAIALLFAPLAWGESQRVVLHPCIIKGVQPSEVAPLQQACFEEINRNAVGVVPSADVVKQLGSLEAHCGSNASSRELKKPRACLGRLATATKAEHAVLITFVLDKERVTSISGSVFDRRGKELGTVSLAANEIPGPLKSAPNRDGWVSTALERLFTSPRIKEQLPGFLDVKRYSGLSISMPEENAVVPVGQKVPVRSRLQVLPLLWPLYPARLELTVRGSNGTSVGLTEQTAEEGVYSTEWTPTEEGEYIIQAAHAGAGDPVQVRVKVLSRCKDYCKEYEVCTRSGCSPCSSGLSILTPAPDAVVPVGREVPVQAELAMIQSPQCEQVLRPKELDFTVTRSGGEVKSAKLNPQQDGRYDYGWTPETPGEYTLQAAGAGQQSTMVRVRVQVKETRSLKPWAVASWITAGGAGVAAGLFGYQSLDAHSKLGNEYKDGAAPTAERKQEIVGLRDNFERNRLVASVSAGVGVAAAVVGTLLWTSGEEPSKPSTASLSVGPGGVGIHVLLP